MLGEKIVYSLLGIFVTFWGLVLLYKPIKLFILFRNTKSFPSVMGTIKSTKIGSFKDQEGGVYYYPEVQFKYVVDGVSYESEGIDISFKVIDQTGREGNKGRDKAQAIIDKYPEDSQVTVYYKPDNPKLAALKLDGQKWSVMFQAIAGTVFLGNGIGFFVIAWWLVS